MICRFHILRISVVKAILLHNSVEGLNGKGTQHHVREMHIPTLPKRDHNVGFGNVNYPLKCEDRGDNPMEPPIYRNDPYFYVRDDERKNKEVIEHLEKENSYTEHKLNHLKETREVLYKELLSHIQETDATYPYKNGPTYEYYTKTIKDKSYTYYCRRKVKDGKEEIILDVNALAEGKSHCDVDDVEPSPDHRLIAYTADFSGYETYMVLFKNLHTGEILADTIKDVTGSIEWGNDNSVLYYSTFDDSHRENKVWRHTIGTSRDKDECLYTENDEEYNAVFYKTRSKRFLIIGSESSETSEFYYIDLHHNPNGNPTLIQKRVPSVEYSVDHHSDSFYIATNKNEATNFKLVKTPITNPSSENWIPVIPYDKDRNIDGIDCFQNHIVVYGREEGFTQIWVMSVTDYSSLHQIQFEEPIYTVEGSTNVEYNTDIFRFGYSSMTTPYTLFDYDMNSKQRTFLKQKPCPNYESSLYQSERLEAIAKDGTVIPMSMVYHKNKRSKKGPSPVHLYGYGSYGISSDPSFDSSILPLLDRGVVYIIAHIRGGGEMGRSWYEDAKYFNKKRTFQDFIACAEFIIQNKITTSQQLTIEGSSAGGLLIGAVLNMRPELFRAALTNVPFVDVMNTMCDPTIPLTTGEWQEWGNPNENKYFHYMLTYSPYDNVSSIPYPNILVKSGLYDPRVGYWEPTKWVLKLRDFYTDHSKDILLKMDLTSGHFSVSDRYHYLREEAFSMSYILDQLNLLGEYYNYKNKESEQLF